MTGSPTYFERLLQALAAGKWVSAQQLPHPIFPHRGFEASVRLLQAVGYAIEQGASGDAAKFRLLRRPSTPHGRTVRLHRDREGDHAGKGGRNPRPRHQ